MAQSKKESNATAVPTPCAGGCGFYGSPQQKNYCSQCFKKFCPEEADKLITASKSSSTSSPSSSQTASSSSSSASASSASDVESKQEEVAQKPARKVQKKKNRCWNCRKKVTLAGQFECKCGYVFCALHRYPDAHKCDFDWKEQHKAKLAKDNKTVAPSKLDKI